MNLPTIDGRECVPVRLLLFLTAWRPLSPDVVAELFSHPDGRRSWDLVSFQLSSGKEPAPWYPRDWDHIHDDLTTLSISLKRSEAFEFEHEREWRRRSVELLPAAVFVWRDELVAHYALKFGKTAFTNTLPSRMELDAAHLRIARLMEDPTASDGADDADTTFLGEVECDEDTERVDDDFRNGDGQLNFARNLPVADTPVVFEGFGSVMLGIQRLARPSDAQAEHEPAVPVALVIPPAQITAPMKREKAAARYDRLLREILVKLEFDPATIPRERGGAHPSETKRLAQSMATSSEYAGQGFTDRTFRGAWERLPKVG